MYVPQTSAWRRLDDDSRARLIDGAVRDVARRAPAGAMVYCATVAALVLGSSCLHDHPWLTSTALVCTFLGGLTRGTAAWQFQHDTAKPRFWSLSLTIATGITVGAWGMFCAAIFYFYTDTWPSTYLLISGAALAGGTLSTLAPQLKTGVAALLFIVLPTVICGFVLGTLHTRILGISAGVYLIFLLFQLRNASDTYWKVATAPALEAMLSRQAATQSAVRFQTLFEDAPSGIYLASRDGRIEMANRALAQMLGYSLPEQIAGRNLKDFSPHDAPSDTGAVMKGREYVVGWESDWHRRDGAQIRVRESIRAVQSENDNQGRLLGIVEDVTALFAADQLRQQLIELLEATSDFVERIAVTGETLYMNRACRALAGAPMAMAEVSVWDRSGDEESRQNRLSFAAKEGIWQGESYLVGADGRQVPVSQVVISHSSGAGSLHSYSIVSRDISAMRDAQKALKETEEKLFQAQRMESIGRLAGGVAHDFNNLLTVINGYGALVLGELTPGEELYQQVKEICKAGDRAAELTMQLLTFSRKQVLQPKILSLNEVIRDADKMLRRLIGEHIELVYNLDPALRSVKSDPGQLHQVIVNLALNARDAMPAGGKLFIETTNCPADESIPADSLAGICSSDCVCLTVRDTGSGMDQATMEHVFEPFFTTKSLGRGTGLGLATVYGIVQQSAGDISVQSELGRGAKFTVRLPAADGIAEPEPSLVPPDKGFETVLLVEDEEEVRRLLVMVLQNHGYRVWQAGDGEEAFRKCEECPDPIDLLVTDVVMPGMRGPDLAAGLQLLYPEMRILYISGYTDLAVPGDFVFGGRSRYLQKPFADSALLRAVREALDSR